MILPRKVASTMKTGISVKIAGKPSEGRPLTVEEICEILGV